MMTAQRVDDGDGARAAILRNRRNWRVAAMSALAALAVGSIIVVGKSGPGHIWPSYAIVAVASMALLLPLTVYFNDRGKDELDRLNALRANSFGLYGCLFGAWSWMVLFSGGIVPLPNLLVLSLATGLVTLGRYTMLKVGR